MSWDLLTPTETHSTCSWKGEARDAAWAYPAPKDAATEITGYVAFWNGVVVEP